MSVAVTPQFFEWWRSRNHVGVARPTQSVRVRKGTFLRGYYTWGGPKVNARIPGETKKNPWLAKWTAHPEDWVDLPNVWSVDLSQDFTQDGIEVATVVLENVLMQQAMGPLGQLYHLIKRGALAPLRGYAPPDWLQLYEQTEWYGMLDRHAQIEVFQGYGTEVQRTFTGLIDDVDTTSAPDRITLTLRDFAGPTLGDQRCFGSVKSKKIHEPVIFKQRTELRGTSVGFDARSSSHRPGYYSRFVLDNSVNTKWLSATHTTDAFTEWIEIHVPRGRYEDILLHPAYANMEMYVGIFARDGGLPDGCSKDGDDIPNGWVAGPGDVPGANGGWHYVRKVNAVSAKGQHVSLGGSYELGDKSVIRLGFRNLYKVGTNAYRAGVARFVAVKEKASLTVIRPEGYDAEASSARDGYPATAVEDNNRTTRWISGTHTTDAFTEWVSVRLPRGKYRSFYADIAYPNMEMYVGVYAHDRAAGTPARMDDVDLPEGWIDNGAGDIVPGANGGWKYLFKVTGVPESEGHSTKFQFGHKLELGRNSILRIGFRNLYSVGTDEYRASVRRLKGNRITTPPEDVVTAGRTIIVDDPSDIVRVVLRWAGFTEWDVDDTGATLKDKWVFSREHTLMDIIKKVQEVTGFVFFNTPGTNDESIGKPVFRERGLLSDEWPAGTLRDTEMLTAVQAKLTNEPLASIIRVRGAAATLKEGGRILGSDPRKLMAVYRPPWHLQGRTAGIIKHHITVNPRYKDQASVEMAARLIALQEALAAAAAQVQCPGTPQFQLDDTVGLMDEGTGLFTRLYVSNRTSRFQAGKNASYVTTLGGALIDTPDVVAMKQEIRELIAQLGLDGATIGTDLTELTP